MSAFFRDKGLLIAACARDELLPSVVTSTRSIARRLGLGVRLVNVAEPAPLVPIYADVCVPDLGFWGGSEPREVTEERRIWLKNVAASSDLPPDCGIDVLHGKPASAVQLCAELLRASLIVTGRG